MSDQKIISMPDSTYSIDRSASRRTLGYQELASLALLLTLFFAWHWRTVGELSIRPVAALTLIFVLCLAYGRIFVALTSKILSDVTGIPYLFLTGYFLFNSLLFILSLASPFGMGVNLTMLCIVAVPAAFLVRKPANIIKALPPGQGQYAPFMAILAAGLGATIWCTDLQAPLHLENGLAVVKAWPDIFIHVREISVFAQAHGLGSIHDIKFAGGTAPLYHFTSYLAPAAVTYLSGATALQVYASFQLPLGLLLTGLAAYCLIGNLIGRRAGVVAIVAILLFPDAYQQGFANRYLSYYFLSQVNLGMLYGIACAALAWLFVLHGCRSGKLGPIVLGYAFLALCLFYKAHVFVANSYLLMIYPVLFFPAIRLRWRLVLGIAATVIFVAVVAYSQQMSRIPVLRLDGSGFGWYVTRLLRDYDPGLLKSFFTVKFLEEDHSNLVELVLGASMLSISTFGLWILALLAVFIKARSKFAPALVWFPILVLANYLMMAIGLALDSRKIGTPDEMLNRPLVWAYFIVGSWSAALLYQTWLGQRMSSMRPAKRIAALGLTAAVGAVVVSSHAANLQTFPTRSGHASYEESSSFPSCQAEIAEYLRLNSKASDVVHDATFDPKFVFTALSERQLYVGSVDFGGASPQQSARLNEIKRIEQLNDESRILEFAETRGIQWFLASPQTILAWPDKLRVETAISCDGYRLYHFMASRTA